MKQKISKHESEVEEEEEKKNVGGDNFDQKKIQSKERVCHVCKKVFGSGKALGGHMRIHFRDRSSKDLNLKVNMKKKLKTQESMKLKKLKNISSSTSSVVEVGRAEPRCALCGKIFPSMKSLFGHMRCHPEREWRGIHPPPPPSPLPTSSWSTNSDAELIDEEPSEPVDLLKVLPKWSVTAKRGRKPVNMVKYDDMEEEFRAAVLHLMMFANGGGDSCDRPYSHFTQRQKQGEIFEVGNRNSNALIVGDHHHQTLMNELVEKEGKGSTDGANNDDSMKSEGKCKDVVVSDDELGSHESSLIGKESSIIMNKKERKMTAATMMMKGSEGKDEDGGTQQQQHQYVCNWNSNISPLELESQSILLQDEVSGHTTGSILDFDLNEVPLVEENHEDEVHYHHTGGCHFASSVSNINHELLK